MGWSRVGVVACWSPHTRGFVPYAHLRSLSPGGIGKVEGGEFPQGKPGPWMLAVGQGATSFSLELEGGGDLGPEKVARLGWLLNDLSSCQHVSLAGHWAEENL